MNIRRSSSRQGTKSVLTYWYRGKRYRLTLGYNLRPDSEREEALKAIQGVHDEANGQPDNGLTFADFVPTYLKRMRINRRAGIHRNEKILEQHLVPFFGPMQLADIRLTHGETYIDHRQRQVDEQGQRLVADGTIERECAVLSAVMNLAVEHEYVPRNRLRAMPVPRGSKRERVASLEELGILLGKASDRLRRAIQVAINTGLRQGRLWAIEQPWIRTIEDGPWLHLPPAMTRTKGNPRKLPLNEPAAGALTIGVTYLQPRRIFDNWSSPTSLSHEFQKLCERCSVQDLTFHDLRHTFATALKGLGVDFEMREILLGHKLPGIVGDYSHDTPEYDRRLRMALNELGKHWQQIPGATSGATRASRKPAASRNPARKQA